jgi:hypothetical protein
MLLPPVAAAHAVNPRVHFVYLVSKAMLPQHGHYFRIITYFVELTPDYGLSPVRVPKDVERAVLDIYLNGAPTTTDRNDNPLLFAHLGLPLVGNAD